MPRLPPLQKPAPRDVLWLSDQTSALLCRQELHLELFPISSLEHSYMRLFSKRAEDGDYWNGDLGSLDPVSPLLKLRAFHWRSHGQLSLVMVSSGKPAEAGVR